MTGGGRATGEIILGAALILAGILLFYGTLLIHVAPTYSRVGPRVFPFAVAAGLGLLGFLYLVHSWRDRQTPAEDHVPHLSPVIIISGALIADALLLVYLGFIPSSALLFVLVAIGFGSRNYLRDFLIGLALSAIAYVTFVHGLGLQLPPGLLAGWW
jgi:putative tricarboxylic transport membrane protein